MQRLVKPEAIRFVVAARPGLSQRASGTAHGIVALEKLRERAYDLVVSDLRMPALDGPGLYRELQCCHPDLCQRIIFLTGDVLSPETQAFLEQTVAPTRSKPFALEEVRRIVQRTLRIGRAGAQEDHL